MTEFTELQGEFRPPVQSRIIFGRGKVATIREEVEGLGGRMESIYYAFGDSDVVTIFELPDNVTMAALSMAVGASGALTNPKTTVLIPIDEAVEAGQKMAAEGG